MCIKSQISMQNFVNSGAWDLQLGRSLRIIFLGLLVYATRTDSIFSSDVGGRPAPCLCNTLLVSINFSCHARMVDRAGGLLRYDEADKAVVGNLWAAAQLWTF